MKLLCWLGVLGLASFDVSQEQLPLISIHPTLQLQQHLCCLCLAVISHAPAGLGANLPGLGANLPGLPGPWASMAMLYLPVALTPVGLSH